MVLLQVHRQRITVFKLERDAPGAVHVDRIPPRPVSPQSMEVETRYVQVRRLASGIEGIEHEYRASFQIRANSAAIACAKQLSQPLVPPGPDHPKCKPLVDICQP